MLDELSVVYCIHPELSVLHPEIPRVQHSPQILFARILQPSGISELRGFGFRDLGIAAQVQS